MTPTTPRRLPKPLRWSSPNSKNFAYTSAKGESLFISINGQNFMFTQKRAYKKRGRK